MPRKVTITAKIGRFFGSLRLNPLGIGVFLIFLGLYIFPFGTDGLLYITLIGLGAPNETLNYFIQANMIMYGLSIALIVLGASILYYNGYKKRVWKIAMQTSPITMKKRRKRR